MNPVGWVEPLGVCRSSSYELDNSLDSSSKFADRSAWLSVLVAFGFTSVSLFVEEFFADANSSFATLAVI